MSAGIDKTYPGKERRTPIATQKAALIQFAVWKASRVATPKKSRNIVKLVLDLIFIISASVVFAEYSAEVCAILRRMLHKEGSEASSANVRP
jgi:hypothetical protein